METVETLLADIDREWKIISRCKQSIENQEPYDMNSIKQQIDISNSKIATMNMKMLYLKNINGVLKIRVTGLHDLDLSTSHKTGKYASDALFRKIKKGSKLGFSKYGNRKLRSRSHDFIIVIHVGGKKAAMVFWNDSKTMCGGDEEVIELKKSRHLDFEIYHTDSRSLCAIGTFWLGSLFKGHSMPDSCDTVTHSSVQLLPRGTLHIQSSYSEKVAETRRDEEHRSKWSTLRRRNTFVETSSSSRRHLSHSIYREHLVNYEIMDIIGIGAFGTVHLAKSHRDNKYYAIKKIDKIGKSKRFETSELNILKQLNHPLICNLIEEFIENGVLYLVLEFCEAGDLHTHLSRTFFGFNEEQITFFAASLVLAVEYLHDQLLVHRDLKPENMMLTRDGYVKVIDFGLCKQLKNRREKIHEIVGTTTHLAAEVRRREPYGIEVDWWALGVSLYQLRLMANHPLARLGYYSSKDVKKHPFFMDTDFEAILDKKAISPYIPFLKDTIDLEYFDQKTFQDSQSSGSTNEEY
ncbi:unnamed protein product [Caenorhabditis bovis]|uniref:Protein kinase domain-containing protein n=1 Tax=Caenorhabditis bovis TaxID=2654633 RepID=A0A8S1E7Y0_9PELO|nr:unnamed protein product [Caenorhabditis bovis]